MKVICKKPIQQPEKPYEFNLEKALLIVSSVIAITAIVILLSKYHA